MTQGTGQLPRFRCRLRRRAGATLDTEHLSPGEQQAVVEGRQAGAAKCDEFGAGGATDVNGWQVGSLWGDSDFDQGDWLKRAGGGKAGIYGNDAAEAMYLLGRTEGIFAETAGGVTVAVTRKLLEQGRIDRDEEIVLCITGNGLKTQDAVAGLLERPMVIGPKLEEVIPLVENARDPVLA